MVIFCSGANALKCEFTDYSSCDLALSENCSTSIIHCDLGKGTPYCYAAWHNNTQLNKVTVVFKVI